MNLLEQYIIEIYSEVLKHFDDWYGSEADFIVVDMMTNCYGRMQRVDKMFRPEEWNQIKEQGYYFA